MSAPPCRCATHAEAVATNCRRAGRVMSKRDWQLCADQCPPEQPCPPPNDGNAYRTLWDHQGEQPAQLPPPRCPHLWKRVRSEDGAVVQRRCPSCGGERLLDVFHCRCPARLLPSGDDDQIILLDCMTCPWKPKIMNADCKAIILKCALSPGDVLAMTAAVYSLHKAHPGKYAVNVDTSCPAIWEHSECIATPTEMATVVAATGPARHIYLYTPKEQKEGKSTPEEWIPPDGLGLIHQSNQRPVHVMQQYTHFLTHALGVDVPLATNRPHLYLSRQEREWLPQVQEITGKPTRYWVVNAGYKTDAATKHYPFYQEVIDRLQGKIVFVQVGRAEHQHRPLRGVLNLLGKTDDRQLIRLVHHASGVLCGVTCLMHLAAALEKPAVILAGGREARTWNTYSMQTLLSTVGSLPCCRHGGCWRARVVKLDDKAEQDGSLCENPVFTDPPAGKCMAMIEPGEVAGAVLKYC